MENALHVPSRMVELFPAIKELLPADSVVLSAREQWLEQSGAGAEGFEVYYASNERPADTFQRAKELWKGHGVRDISGNSTVRSADGQGWRHTLNAYEGGGGFTLWNRECSAPEFRCGALAVAGSLVPVGEVFHASGTAEADVIAAVRSAYIAGYLRSFARVPATASDSELWEDGWLRIRGEEAAPFERALRSLGFAPGEEQVWTRGEAVVEAWPSGSGAQLKLRARPIADRASARWALAGIDR